MPLGNEHFNFVFSVITKYLIHHVMECHHRDNKCILPMQILFKRNKESLCNLVRHAAFM